MATLSKTIAKLRKLGFKQSNDYSIWRFELGNISATIEFSSPENITFALPYREHLGGFYSEDRKINEIEQETIQTLQNKLTPLLTQNTI